MIKSFIIIALCLIHYETYAQTFNLTSFDNKVKKVKIETAPRRQLHIICLKDTLRLLDYDELIKPKVYSDKFLMIEYRTRGGTGAAVGNTAVICSEGNKLRVAALFGSYSDLSLNDGKHIVQAYKWGLTGHKGSYLLQIDPVKHQEKSVLLKFDNKRKIFYQEISLISKTFKINNTLTEGMSNVFVNDSIPIVTVGTNKYLNIKANWYIEGFDRSLFKQYY